MQNVSEKQVRGLSIESNLPQVLTHHISTPILDEHRWHSRSILNLVLYHDANHYADDYKHNKNDEEANPSFLRAARAEFTALSVYCSLEMIIRGCARSGCVGLTQLQCLSQPLLLPTE